MDQDSPFAPILGRVPSGIFILTARHCDDATGMLASWVMQAGFDPPMLTVAVKQGRYVCDWLTDGRPFVINVVGESDKTLLKHFGRGFDPGEPAFEGVEHTQSQQGIAMLSAAIGHLECEPVSHVDSGDHRIFLSKIVDGASSSDDPPMVHIRKSGAHY